MLLRIAMWLMENDGVRMAVETFTRQGSYWLADVLGVIFWLLAVAVAYYILSHIVVIRMTSRRTVRHNGSLWDAGPR